MHLTSYLSKPVDPSNNCISSEISADHSIDKNEQQISILVVEDNRLNQKVAVTLLNDLGYKQIDVVSTGQEALNLLKNHSFSIVLLDIGLPDISGIDVCKTIRASEEYRSTIIVAVTAHIDEQLKDECFKCGFDSVIFKPFDYDDLEGVFELVTTTQIEMTS